MAKIIYYCFTFFDNVTRKKCRHNNNTRYGAIRYRNEILMNNSRYSKISDIFTDTLDYVRPSDTTW